MLYFICITQIILTLLAYIAGNISYTHNNWISHLGILCLSVITILFSFVTYRFLKDIRKIHRRSALARSLLSVLSDADEIIIVDEHLNITYAKYFPESLKRSNNQFIFKDIIRDQFIDHNNALDLCEKAIDHGIYFEDTFRTKKNKEFEPENWIWIRVLPLYTTPSVMPQYRAIILSDITLYQNKSLSPTSFNSIGEKYLDCSPFGFIHVNSKGEIIKLNETLKKWLGASIEKSIGALLSTITDIPSAKIETVLKTKASVLIKLKPNKIDQITTLLFSTKISEDYYILALCKQDNNLIKQSHNHPLNQLPIPSLLMDKSCEISAINTSFSSLFSPAYIREYGSPNTGDNLLAYLDESSKTVIESLLTKLSSSKMTVSTDMKFIHSGPSFIVYTQNIGNEKFLLQLIDMSEQKKLEQQFVQAQKTQAVGQLAGGIAHDFNNLLTAMLGFCDLLLQRVMPNDPSYPDIMHIKQNANRASNLVRQLLAFSRRQSLQPRKINVTDALSEISSLLRRLIGSQINFKVSHYRNLWPVKVDVSQFEQVIINIVVNARDAMPSGGNLTIETSNYTNTAAQPIGNDILIAGDYILIKISDTGCGIPSDMISSIFEPFFSTKEVGAGTGLGLATAYGIVKQTGGAIGVESQVGTGTTFKIFLPRCKDKDTPTISPSSSFVTDVTGTETILLVEDEDAVRIFAARALRDKGYRVLEAQNGETAITLTQQTRPDVLITDVVMPKMDGPTLSQKIKEIVPDIPVIFTSGYTEETFRKGLSEDHSIHFLSKPFTLRDLATKVREVLQNQKKDSNVA